MKSRLSSLALLAGALLLLVSLYLPWREGTREFSRVFEDRLTLDGWSSGVGDAAALAALALAGAAAVGLAKPGLAPRLPLRRCALLTGYLGLAALAQTRTLGPQYAARLEWAYGAYAAFAAALLLLIAAVPAARPRVDRRAAVTIVLPGALLVSLLLPWLRPGLLGISVPAAAVAAALSVGIATSKSGLPLAGLAAALFAGGAFVSFDSLFLEQGQPAYGAWAGLGIAAALALTALVEVARRRRPASPAPLAVATGAAALVLVTSLFLPWHRWCVPPDGGFDLPAGRCFSSPGWTTTAGAGSAVLAILVLVATVARPRRPPFELTAALGLLVATIALQTLRVSDAGLGYGAVAGSAAAAVLVGLAVGRLRPSPVAVPRLLPLTAGVAFLGVLVVPWWNVLPPDLQLALGFSAPSWPTIAALVLGIHLLVSWAGDPTGALLVAIPLAILALNAVDIAREDRLGWRGGALIALGLLLALLGRLERRGGLRVPEILRIDRIRV